VGRGCLAGVRRCCEAAGGTPQKRKTTWERSMRWRGRLLHGMEDVVDLGASQAASGS